MDPETVKALVPILATVVGAIIASMSGWAVARENQKAQRIIAQDNARRGDLKELLAPLRARVVERFAKLDLAQDAAIYLSSIFEEEDDAATIANARRAVEAVSDRSELYRSEWTASGSAEITARFREWRDAERACSQLIASIDNQGPHDGNVGDKARAAWKTFEEATAALTTAINETIHGGALVTTKPARWGIRAQLSSLVGYD